jgi:hypothetical protein
MKTIHCWLLTASLLLAGLMGTAAEWTVMVYLAGDGNNEADCIQDFLEMATVGSNSDVNILVQFDRVPGYIATYDNWTIANRYRILTGMEPTTAGAVGDWGDGLGGRETDTSSRYTLTHFLNWGIDNYPAKHYALIMAGRGADWRGLCGDETSKDKYLSVKDLRRALDAAKKDMNLVGFAVDRMATLEVAYELYDTDSQVMVASEGTLLEEGWPYHLILAELVASPAWTPAQFGAAIVDRCFQSYGNDRQFSALDLTAMEALGVEVKNLKKSLVDDWEANPAAPQAAAANVLTALGNVVIHQRNGVNWPGATGLGIYAPSTKRDSAYTTTLLTAVYDTRWDSLLNNYYNDMRGSWVSAARLGTQEFTDPEFIDLGDFCFRLAVPVDPRIYVESEETKGFTTSGGVAQDWKADEQCWTQALPFTFNFYGTDYNQVHVCSNGYLDFTNNVPAYQNSTVDLINATRIAPLWDDLDTTDGNIYVHQPDARSILFRWKAKKVLDNTWVNVSAVLHDTGDIEFHYGSGNKDLTPTVGLSSGNGTAYDISAFHSGETSLSGAKTLLFSTPAPLVKNGRLADDFISHVDVVFDQPVFANNDGTGALAPADLKLVFDANGGPTVDIAIAEITDTDGNPLVGGETIIRVLLNITGGPPTGVETVDIGPADRTCIFNADGYPAPDTSTTLDVNINGIPVTQGSVFSVAAGEINVALVQLTRKPSVKGEYFDPIKDPGQAKAKKATVKVVTAVSAKAPLPAVDCEWTKKTVLFNKSAHTAAYAAGQTMAEILAADPMFKLNHYLPVITTEGVRYDVRLDKALLLVAPGLTDTTTVGGVPVVNARPGDTVRLVGNWFGVKAPKVWLEYKTTAGKVKMKTCKMVKPLPYPDRLGNPGKSCMDLTSATGDSLVDVIIPTLPTSWDHGVEHNLVIDNGIGRGTIAFATVAP